MCDGGVRYIFKGNDNLKLCHSVFLDQGVLTVGSEHHSRLVEDQATMDTALQRQDKP